MVQWKFQVDQLVVLDPEYAGSHAGTVWRITALPRGKRGVNYTAANHRDPNAQGLRAPEWMLREFSDDGSAPVVSIEPYHAPPPVGAVVTVNDPKKRIPVTELFVVMKIGSRINISRLGGHPNHGFWRVPQSWLTVVALTEVPERIAAHLTAIGTTT